LLKKVKFGIKTKILIILIPLLICSFAISGYISVVSSRKTLSDISSQFMAYKIDELYNYSYSQWQNLQTSGFGNDSVYIEIVEKSVESYAKGMIREDSEIIFAFNNDGELVFSTNEMDYNESDWEFLKPVLQSDYKKLLDFSISRSKFTGLTKSLPHLKWIIVLAEDRQSYTKEITEMTYFQIIVFFASLFIITVSLILSLSAIISPIYRFSKAINDITIFKDFSRKVKIEYPDEIGELAFEFNDMTSNLDLAYKKLKKYALDEAIARKEIIIREKETLDVLGRASDYKDQETGAHILRVSKYSLLLSRALGQSKAIQDLLYYASPLHDIGKIGIPDHVLLKQGNLTVKEFDIIKTHTTLGYEILQNLSSKYLKAGAVIALSHHEKFDGSGYPKGLEGADIPIFGRIVSLADVFDALTSKRPYKDPWPIEDILDYINAEKGKHFDPNLVELFIHNFSEVEKILKTNSND
jgi:response regulator RpfG family c-di-GMP phosphodiesterase